MGARDDIDAFIAAKGKTLPAEPEWRSATSRIGERRCSLPIAVGGRLSNVHLGMTVNVRDDDYLVINLLAPICVTRLCLSLDHFDRARNEFVAAPHWHPWVENRPKGQALPKELRHAVNLTGKISGRDEAFIWFLQQTGIESPSWELIWPGKDVLL